MFRFLTREISGASMMKMSMILFGVLMAVIGWLIIKDLITNADHDNDMVGFLVLWLPVVFGGIWFFAEVYNKNFLANVASVVFIIISFTVAISFFIPIIPIETKTIEAKTIETKTIETKTIDRFISLVEKDCDSIKVRLELVDRAGPEELCTDYCPTLIFSSTTLQGRKIVCCEEYHSVMTHPAVGRLHPDSNCDDLFNYKKVITDQLFLVAVERMEYLRSKISNVISLPGTDFELIMKKGENKLILLKDGKEKEVEVHA